jgi:hypothetical protein
MCLLKSPFNQNLIMINHKSNDNFNNYIIFSMNKNKPSKITQNYLDSFLQTIDAIRRRKKMTANDDEGKRHHKSKQSVFEQSIYLD